MVQRGLTAICEARGGKEMETRKTHEGSTATAAVAVAEPEAPDAGWIDTLAGSLTKVVQGDEAEERRRRRAEYLFD
jgi:hypothetical protein